MQPRKNEKHEPKLSRIALKGPKLRVVKLEPRIAPALTSNHNETIVHDPAKAKPKADEPPKGESKPRLQIARLERRIAPGFALNHNEMLVREPAKGKLKPKLRIVKLEERIAPGIRLQNHDEMLVRDRD